MTLGPECVSNYQQSTFVTTYNGLLTHTERGGGVFIGYWGGLVVMFLTWKEKLRLSTIFCCAIPASVWVYCHISLICFCYTIYPVVSPTTPDSILLVESPGSAWLVKTILVWQLNCWFRVSSVGDAVGDTWGNNQHDSSPCINDWPVFLSSWSVREISTLKKIDLRLSQ